MFPLAALPGLDLVCSRHSDCGPGVDPLSRPERDRGKCRDDNSRNRDSGELVRRRLSLADEVARQGPFVAGHLGRAIVRAQCRRRQCRRYVLCLDTGSGKILWQKDYESATYPLSSLNNYASSTPTVDEQHVYAAWATLDHLTIRALSHEGEEVWQRDLGPYISEHGFGNSPIVFEDLVILVNSQQAEELDPDQQPGTSSVVALDRMTGEVRWTTPRKAARVCYGTPCLYEPPNGPSRIDLLRHGRWLYQLGSANRKGELDLSRFHDADRGVTDHRRRPRVGQ